MKYLFLLLSVVIFYAAASCKKNNPDVKPEPEEVIYPDYTKLKTGNYWIYQHYRLDASGNETAVNQYDSCYVEKDTSINGKNYFKVYRPNYVSNNPFIFLRDSLHYIVNQNGGIFFSSEDFTTVFKSYYEIIPPEGEPKDTICKVTVKMDDRNESVTTPAGTFITSNFKTTFNFYPNWQRAGNPRYMHTRYAKNVGIVTETLPIYAANPNYTERRLVRYKVE